MKYAGARLDNVRAGMAQRDARRKVLMREKIQGAIRRLQERDVVITRKRLCFEAGISRTALWRHLRADPSLAALSGISFRRGRLAA